MAEAKKMTEDERRYFDQRFGDMDRRMTALEGKFDTCVEGFSATRSSIAVLGEKAENTEEACEARHASSSARLGRLEGNQRWIALTVIGAVVAAVLASVGLRVKGE